MPVQLCPPISSQTELHTPLARPVLVAGEPPRAFVTILDALASLNDHVPGSSAEVDDVIDTLMRAAQSQDPALLARATDRFESTLRKCYAAPDLMNESP
ncbi:hypothetical protein [Ancylobacter sp. SL191]|uniref:hypothetical protein n=1 Tax=Ancylobacter sp. SL191 TaxID=2995166 RepID=UPI002270D6B7|nr:hypothetical protein [Ancylobacter sp. SL191]WAC27481.1 hypothetical protein OU996_21205 [Ancylobacter sp. SL191]